jgi:hypothetical protein
MRVNIEQAGQELNYHITSTMKQQTLLQGKRLREETEQEAPSKKAKVDTNKTSDMVSESVGKVNKGHFPGWPLVPALPSFDVKSAFSGVEGQVIRKEPGLDLLYFKHFLKGPGRASLFKYLLEELPWYRVSSSFP